MGLGCAPRMADGRIRVSVVAPLLRMDSRYFIKGVVSISPALTANFDCILVSEAGFSVDFNPP